MKKTSIIIITVIALVIIGAILTSTLLALSMAKAGVKTPDKVDDTTKIAASTPHAPELYAGGSTEGATYKLVELGDVMGYSDTRNNTYIRTLGIVVGAEHDDYGGSILLSDGLGSYVLVAICHACIREFTGIMPELSKGTNVEVSGMAFFTAPADSDLEKKFNLTIRLPETIGMIDLDEIWVIG